MTAFSAAILGVAILSGATASVVGFGIGSLLTPLLAVQLGTDVAIAAVMIPHAAATAFRCWRLRTYIDTDVLLRFGSFSAIGALFGALLYARLSGPVLTRVLGALLLLTAAAQFAGLASRWRPRGVLVSVLGVCSGFFGGVAGNQGGLRAAALTAFALPPLPFVATATATGLLVDVIRAPVYLWTAAPALVPLAIWIGIATAGVLAGTVIGERMLLGLSPERFGRTVAAAIAVLGVWLVSRAA